MDKYVGKYIAFKIFDSKDHPNGMEGIKDKQVKKYYTWVHEDYYVGIIKANLEEGNVISEKERLKALNDLEEKYLD